MVLTFDRGTERGTLHVLHPNSARWVRGPGLRKPQVRLLHTSDLHLGSDIGITGTAWHGARCVCPLIAVARLAERERCHLLLIAGDLFDRNSVPEELVHAAMSVLADLSIPCVIVPGNHDVYDETSVYLRFDFERHAPLVRVAREASGQMFTFESFSTSVWAKPVIVHDPHHRPLTETPPRPEDVWYVIAGHGQYTSRDRFPGTLPSSPISAADLDLIEANYVALGHEDVTGSVGNSGVPTWYSGAPHGAGGAREALVVTLDESTGVTVEPREVPIIGTECLVRQRT